MIQYWLTGCILGLSAGLSPGPLLALVVSETFRHGMSAGIKVALAPIVTDVPIIFFALFVLVKLSGFDLVLGIISIVGGALVLFMGIDGLRVSSVAVDLNVERPHSLRRGIMVNALSPHPYLFWISVGAPTTIKGMDQTPAAAVLFVLGFYALLISAKVLLAVLVGRSRSFLTGRVYILIMRGLGGILIVFAFFLFRDGLRSMGVL